MLRYLCNFCKREMSLEERQASAMVAAEWGARNKSLQLILQTNGEYDTFCPNHLPFAEEYWNDKVLILERMNKQTVSALSNHCKEFFKDNESKGLSGTPHPVVARSQN